MATRSATTPKPLKDRIREANTAYTHQTELHARLMQYSQTTPHSNVDEQFRERLHAGEDPAHLIDDYVTAKNRENIAQQFGRIVADILQRTASPRSREAQFADQALDLCRDELATIMSRVTKHRALLEQHPATIDAALAAGSLDDYRTVEQILDDYDALRVEYGRQIRLQDAGLTGPKIGAVECRHFVDVDLYFVNKRRRASILEGYPDEQILAWFRPEQISTSSRAEHLLLIADNEPWLPNADELGKVNHAVDQLCAHQWHTGNLGRDRHLFADYQAQLNNIVFNEPLPEPALTRRLA
ncbi:MAG: hypothetical protein WBA05_17950 [Gordonia sp. (in: high G+C Gram-positive bacteria)]|uniref:hypothetical protein n=1 Tax=Gordonia sp. (in: high G+C Gram-positive bacteria) TaxID=84139 RepID=UPI003C714507